MRMRCSGRHPPFKEQISSVYPLLTQTLLLLLRPGLLEEILGEEIIDETDIVTDNISHPIHHSLNLLAALNDRLFSSLLLGDGDPHVFFHLFLIFLFTGLEFSQSLLFVIQVVLNNFHCSLTILDLLGGFGFSIFL